MEGSKSSNTPKAKGPPPIVANEGSIVQLFLRKSQVDKPDAAPVTVLTPVTPSGSEARYSGGSISEMYEDTGRHSTSSIASLASLMSDDEKAKALQKQIEFYFSDANLQTDKYMTKMMDEEGFVPLSVIGQFKRVKKLTTDIEVIADALSSSTELKLSEDRTKIARIAPMPEFNEHEILQRSVVAYNLPASPSIEGLTKLFSQCGVVKVVRIFQPGKKSNYSNQERDELMQRGLYAVIEFETTEQAQKAAEELTEKENWRSGMKVELKGARPAEGSRIMALDGPATPSAGKKNKKKNKKKGIPSSLPGFSDSEPGGRSSIDSAADLLSAADLEDSNWRVPQSIRQERKDRRAASYDLTGGSPANSGSAGYSSGPERPASASSAGRRTHKPKAASIDVTNPKAGERDRGATSLSPAGRDLQSRPKVRSSSYDHAEGAPESPGGRNSRPRGTIHSIVKDGGFIKPVKASKGARTGTIFFRFSELPDGFQLMLGEEVEYTVETDALTGDRVAAKIKKASAQKPSSASPAAAREAPSASPSAMPARLNLRMRATESSPRTPSRQFSPQSSPTAAGRPRFSPTVRGAGIGREALGHVEKFKMALGPDGSKGFAAGRGKTLGLPMGNAGSSTPGPLINVTVQRME